jgi:hypothetical protein
VVEIQRKNDKILSIKIMIGGEIATIISAYALQVKLDNLVEQQFWKYLDEVVQSIPYAEKLFIGDDLNGHMGFERTGFENVHGGQGFGDKNEAGTDILNFALTYDLTIANTWFKKRNSHLVTFRSGLNASQIDFFITRRRFRSGCTNCKVIPGKSVVTQYRLLVLDFYFKKQGK